LGIRATVRVGCFMQPSCAETGAPEQSLPQPVGGCCPPQAPVSVSDLGRTGVLAIILLPACPPEARCGGRGLWLVPLLFVSVELHSGEVPWPDELC
jgi:hypothetical protein